MKTREEQQHTENEMNNWTQNSQQNDANVWNAWAPFMRRTF